jgi:hypothetical protein
MSGFRPNWTAEVLRQPPLIAPARHYTWPRQIAGEEDALARGALQVLVKPAAGGVYLLTCALGFVDPSMPSGVFACPDPEELCVVSGGYAYLAPVSAPERCTQIGLKPVVAVHPAEAAGLLLFVGFQTIVAWGRGAIAWESARLSWEGVRVTEVGAETVKGFGWELMTDREVEFVLDLTTGAHRGGGFPQKAV